MTSKQFFIIDQLFTFYAFIELSFLDDICVFVCPEMLCTWYMDTFLIALYMDVNNFCRVILIVSFATVRALCTYQKCFPL